MAALHDEATKTLLGCLPEDIYNITTGRVTSSTISTGTSSSTSTRTVGKYVKAKHQPTLSTVFCTQERIEIDSTDSELDLFEDDDSADESEDQYDGQSVAPILGRSVGTSCKDLIILVDVAVQTDSEVVSKQVSTCLNACKRITRVGCVCGCACALISHSCVCVCVCVLPCSECRT